VKRINEFLKTNAKDVVIGLAILISRECACFGWASCFRIGLSKIASFAFVWSNHFATAVTRGGHFFLRKGIIQSFSFGVGSDHFESHRITK